MLKKTILIIISIFCVLSMSSCKSNSNYTKNNEPGAVLISSYDDVVKMKTSNEKFIVLFTLIDCSHCHNFHQMLKTYLNTHKIFLYEVILDMEFKYQEINNKVNEHFPYLNHAPTIYLIDENKILSEFKYKETDKLELLFDKWVQNNKLNE